MPIRAMNKSADVAVVGGGIMGLAMAHAAVMAGRRVVLLERHAQAAGASTAGYGLISAAGQLPGQNLARALRSRQLWSETATAARIPIESRGLLVPAYRAEGRKLIESHVAAGTGDGALIVSAGKARELVPALRAQGLLGALWAPDELHVDARTALIRIARWLADVHGVEIVRNCLVREVRTPDIITSSGLVRAETTIVCPGDDFLTLFPERIAHYKLTRSKSQMLRVRPAAPGRLGCTVGSDSTLLRLPAVASQSAAATLAARLDGERPELLDAGVGLTVTQSADGSFVVGDSRQFAPTHDPVSQAAIDALILGELDRVLDLPGRVVSERWVAQQPQAADRPMLIDRPSPSIRIVMMTGGAGFASAFAIAEEVVADLFQGQTSLRAAPRTRFAAA